MRHTIPALLVSAVLAALSVLVALPALAQSTGPVLHAIVISGDPSPDGNGAFGQVGVPSINDAGDVSFAANLTGTLTPQALFVERSGGLDLVARMGDAAPDGNGAYAGFGLGPVPLNDDGEVAYQAGVSGTTGGFADNAGVFRSGQPSLQIVREGQASPDANGIFDTFLSVGIEDNGDVHFWASLTGTSGGAFVDDRGVYRGPGASGDVAGPLDQLLRMGELAFPGGPIRFGNVDSNLAGHPSGRVAIRTFLDDPTNPGPSTLAIFVDDGATRSQRLAAGDESPDADGTIFSFPIPFVGADGTVASHVTFEGTLGGLSENMGIASYPVFTDSRVLAREGDAAPEDGTFAVDFTDALAFASTQVSPSRMAFHAFLSGTPGGSSDDTGLFLATPSGVSEIVRQGDTISDLDGEFDEFRFGRVHVNPIGRVVFFADVRNATRGAGLFTSGPSSPVTPIARVGQPLFGSTIQLIEILDDDQARIAGVSPLNAFGDVTFRVRLLDGREAIIATTVPEPSTGLLAGVAASAIAVLRGSRRIVAVRPR